jgi:hypothetical protein
MVIVTPNVNNTVSYYVRYDSIHSFEILDHSSRIVYSGVTNIQAVNGKIVHSGITYVFEANDTFTYKSYFISGGTSCLANQTLLKSYTEDTAYVGLFKSVQSELRKFKSIKSANSGATNKVITYYSRYNQVDRFEILDHNSRIVYSGLTSLTAISGKITHTINDYEFAYNEVFTYKSYYNNYLANQTLLKYVDDSMFGVFKIPTKEANTFKTIYINLDYVYDDYVFDDYV